MSRLTEQVSSLNEQLSAQKVVCSKAASDLAIEKSMVVSLQGEVKLKSGLIAKL